MCSEQDFIMFKKSTKSSLRGQNMCQLCKSCPAKVPSIISQNDCIFMLSPRFINLVPVTFVCKCRKQNIKSAGWRFYIRKTSLILFILSSILGVNEVSLVFYSQYHDVVNRRGENHVCMIAHHSNQIVLWAATRSYLQNPF